MIRTILVPLLGLKDDESALQSAFQLADWLDAHIDCLHVRPDANANALPMTGYAMGVSFLTPDLYRYFEDSARKSADSARRKFEEFCVRTGITQVDQPLLSRLSASFSEAEGDLIPVIVEHAKTHELVVLRRNPGYFGFNEEALGDILVGCGRPVLLAADEPQTACGRHVAISWKATAETARAITAAMPILEKAEKISILSTEEESTNIERAAESVRRLAKELGWHGLVPEIRHLRRSPDGADATLREAQIIGADLLVMGAYGHSRVRELFFGGFTRRVLRSAPLSIFLAH